MGTLDTLFGRQESGRGGFPVIEQVLSFLSLTFCFRKESII
jgi:hypothetical protein